MHLRKLLIAGAALMNISGISIQSAYAGKADDTLNAAFKNEIETLDYYKAVSREALSVGRLLYDGLLSKDFSNGQFKPEIASSYKFTSDKEIEFKIRKDVKFHNGEPLTAEDVAFTLNLVSRPEFDARYAISVNWIDKAEVIDAETVKLTMKSVYPVALEMLAGNIPIYSRKYYEAVGPQGMAVKPIGTGPYKLTDLTPGAAVKLERFDQYYTGGQKENPKISKIHFRILKEQNTQYAELFNGKLDWIWRVPKDDIARVGSRAGLKTDSRPIMRFDFLAMNVKVPNSPLADVRVRRAINYAINRKDIRDAFRGETSPIINSACNPVQFGCETNVTTYGYDPAKAKALLKEAGVSNIKLNMVIRAEGVAIAEAMKANLAAVGINVQLNSLQYSTAVEQWRSLKQDLSLGDWGSYGIGDVALGAGTYFSGTGDDVVADPDIVPLMKNAGSTLDPEKRKKMYSEGLKLIADRAYWVPLWVWNLNTAMSSDLKLTVNPDEFIPFYDAEWK